MTNTESFAHKSYSEIYNILYQSLINDNVDLKIAAATARRLTEDIWDLHLVLNTGVDKLNNTIDIIKNIIQDRFKTG